MESATTHRYSIMRRIMMRTYDLILPENLPLVSKDRLFEMYNEAVQEIWHLITPARPIVDAILVPEVKIDVNTFFASDIA